MHRAFSGGEGTLVSVADEKLLLKAVKRIANVRFTVGKLQSDVWNQV